MMNHTKSERKMIKRGVFYSSKISSVFLQKNFKNNLRNQKIFTIFASSKGRDGERPSDACLTRQSGDFRKLRRTIGPRPDDTRVFFTFH